LIKAKQNNIGQGREKEKKKKKGRFEGWEKWVVDWGWGEV